MNVRLLQSMHSSEAAGSNVAANKRTTYWKMSTQQKAVSSGNESKTLLNSKSTINSAMDKLLSYFYRYRFVSAALFCGASIFLHHSLGSQADVIIATYLLISITTYILVDTLPTTYFLLASILLLLSTLATSVILPPYVLHSLAPICIFALLLSGYDLLSPQSWILGTLLGVIRSYAVPLPRAGTFNWEFNIQNFITPPMHDMAAGCCIMIAVFIIGCNVLFPTFITPQAKLLDIFRVALPKAPVVTVKDIGSDSLTLYWSSEDDIDMKHSSTVQPLKPDPCDPCEKHVEVAKHVIEMNGIVVGESEKKETSVAVTGLSEDTIFRLRVWAVTHQDWRTPSDMIVIRTRKASILNGFHIKDDFGSFASNEDQQEWNGSSQASNTEQPLRRQSVPEHLRNRLAALQAHLAETEKQNQELSQQIDQFSAHHASTSGIVAEAEVLRTRKKQEDEARIQIKHQSKSLDDRKRALESELAKVERALRAAKDARQTTINNQDSKARDMQILKDRMISDDLRVTESMNARKATTETLQGQIEARKLEIIQSEEYLSTLAKTHRELDEQVRQVQSDIEAVRSSTADPAQTDVPTAEETFHYAEERYHIAVEKYSSLEASHRQLQSNLMTIMQSKAEKTRDLHRLRRWAEMDRLAAENTLTHDNHNLEYTSSPTEEPDVFADAQMQRGMFARRSSSGNHHGWPSEMADVGSLRSFTPPLGPSLMRRGLSPRPRNTVSNLDLYSDYSLLPSTLMSDVDGTHADPPLPSPLDPASALTRRVSPSTLGSNSFSRNVRAESPSSSGTDNKLGTHPTLTSFPDLVFNSVSTDATSNFGVSAVFAPSFGKNASPLTSPISSLNGVPFQRSSSPIQKHHIPDALRAPGSVPGRQQASSPEENEYAPSDPVLPLSSAAALLHEQPARNATPPISQVGGIAGSTFGLWDSPFKAGTNGVWNPASTGDGQGQMHALAQGQTRFIWQEPNDRFESSE